ncbi:MAG: peptidyl-tRNA hydrolase [Candidatus Korarchaeota archaeon]|nr:peptidyl-tRNA hydrolase [Candidatus Korarchaeota archaeon]
MRYKQVIAVRKDLGMSCGKLAVQVAHASVEAAEIARKRIPEIYRGWREEGGKKVVVQVDSEEELMKVYQEALQRGLVAVLIRDAGLTELEPGTPTTVGIGPHESEKVDKVTGRLRLYK